MDIFTIAMLKKKADLVDGKIPASMLPSYVDEAVEYPSLSDFPTSGDKSKIYVAIDTKNTYRWSGTVYIQVNAEEGYVTVTELEKSIFEATKDLASTLYVDQKIDNIIKLDTSSGEIKLQGTLGQLINDVDYIYSNTLTQFKSDLIAGKFENRPGSYTSLNSIDSFKAFVKGRNAIIFDKDNIITQIDYVDNVAQEKKLFDIIKEECKDTDSGKGQKELIFKTHFEFPSVGAPTSDYPEEVLYVATQENKIYYWSPEQLRYVEYVPKLAEILEASADENGQIFIDGDYNIKISKINGGKAK